MSFPAVIPSFDRTLTQLCSHLLTRVISLYICTLKTHICTRHLTRCVILCMKRTTNRGIILQVKPNHLSDKHQNPRQPRLISTHLHITTQLRLIL